MQNKANFLDTQMLAGSVMTKHYEQKTPFTTPAKQTQSNPIKPNFKGIKPLIIGFSLGI